MKFRLFRKFDERFTCGHQYASARLQLLFVSPRKLNVVAVLLPPACQFWSNSSPLLVSFLDLFCCFGRLKPKPRADVALNDACDPAACDPAACPFERKNFPFVSPPRLSLRFPPFLLLSSSVVSPCPRRCLCFSPFASSSSRRPPAVFLALAL